MSFNHNYSTKQEIKIACAELVGKGILKEVVMHLKENIYRKFDSHTLRDSDELLLLKSQLEGIKLIQKTIEELGNIKPST